MLVVLIFVFVVIFGVDRNCVSVVSVVGFDNVFLFFLLRCSNVIIFNVFLYGVGLVFMFMDIFVSVVVRIGIVFVFVMYFL